MSNATLLIGKLQTTRPISASTPEQLITICTKRAFRNSQNAFVYDYIDCVIPTPEVFQPVDALIGQTLLIRGHLDTRVYPETTGLFLVAEKVDSLYATAVDAVVPPAPAAASMLKSAPVAYSFPTCSSSTSAERDNGLVN